MRKVGEPPQVIYTMLSTHYFQEVFTSLTASRPCCCTLIQNSCDRQMACCQLGFNSGTIAGGFSALPQDLCTDRLLHLTSRCSTGRVFDLRSPVFGDCLVTSLEVQP